MTSFRWISVIVAILVVTLVPLYTLIGFLMVQHSKVLDRQLVPVAMSTNSDQVPSAHTVKSDGRNTTAQTSAPVNKEESKVATTQQSDTETPQQISYDITFSPSFIFQGPPIPEKEDPEVPIKAADSEVKNTVDTPATQPVKNSLPPKQTEPEQKRTKDIVPTATLLVMESKTGKQYFITGIPLDKFSLDEGARRLKSLTSDNSPDVERFKEIALQPGNQTYRSFFDLSVPSEAEKVVELTPTEKANGAKTVFPLPKGKIFRTAVVKSDGVTLEYHPVVEIDAWTELPGYVVSKQ